MDRLSEIALKTPGVHDTIGITGFSVLTGANSSAAGTIFLPLDSFGEREGKPELQGQAIARKLSAQFSQVQDGLALVFPPPPVRGIGSAGGFKLQIQDRSGAHTPQELQTVVDDLIGEARKHTELQSLFTSFRANVPQLYANLDRVTAKEQNVAVTDAFTALQVYLGSLYVNDFNYLGRTFRVIAQADAPFRARAKDGKQCRTRNASSGMGALGAVMDRKDCSG